MFCQRVFVLATIGKHFHGFGEMLGVQADLKGKWAVQGALARCLADGECLENLVCLQLCNGKADESACQARIGDSVL